MHRRLLPTLLGGLLLTGVAPLVAASPASAVVTTHTVTTTGDVVDAGDGLLSLREAVSLVATDSGDSEIVLQADSTYHLSICDGAPPEHENVNGDLDVQLSPGTLTITGNGATVVQDCDLERVLLSERPLVVRHLTVRGASNETNGATGEANGGGIFAYETLTVEDSVITDNHSSGWAALYASGDLTVLRSTISDNTSTFGDPGIATTGFTGDVTITDSTLTNNTGRYASVAHAGETLTVRNSTVSGTTGTSLSSVNSVLSGNSGVVLDHATVADNTYAPGPTLVGPTLDLTGSIVVGTTLQACDSASTVISHGGNVLVDDSCGTPDATDQIDIADAGLGPVADNGGPTPTRLPDIDSPALDTQPAAACADLTTDERGLPRPAGDCDAGAVELQRQIDAQLRLGTRPFRGDGVHNTTGQGQSYRAVVRRGGTATFVLRAENDGEVADTLHLKGLPGRGAVIAHYARAGHDLTAAMTAGTDVARPAHTATTVTARIHVSATAPHGLVRRFPLTVTSASGTVDRVIATIQVR